MSDKTVSLCMIIKNEERFLEKCLRSVADLVDEIIIVDTGSTDSSMEIAKKFNAKIFNYIWEDDFSKARNFGLKEASCDWILSLDGDEELDRNDVGKLKYLVNNFTLDGAYFSLYNLTGNGNNNDYFIHNVMKIFKNHEGYKYFGEIHEQLKKEDGSFDVNKFVIEDIRVIHYGYLDSVANGKNKKGRNVPILEKQIEMHPESGFVLFNLGNEYFSQENYEKALSYYLDSYAKTINKNTYYPHLLYRLNCCYEIEENYEEALKYLEEAVETYPKCTDFEFIKGSLFHKIKKYDLAIESYRKCLRQGPPSIDLVLVNGCGTFRPAKALADLYLENEEYKKALQYLNKTLELSRENIGVMYGIGLVLNKLLQDKNEVKSRLYGYFKDKNYEPNVLFVCENLINEGLYDLALDDLNLKDKNKNYDLEFKFLKAKALFYKKDYVVAKKLFKKIVNNENKTITFMTTIFVESSKFLLIMDLIENNDLNESLNLVKKFGDEVTYRISSDFCKLINPLTNFELSKEFNYSGKNRELILVAIVDILSKVYKSENYKLFDKMLNIFNKTDNKNSIINLSRLYYDKKIKDSIVTKIIEIENNNSSKNFN